MKSRFIALAILLGSLSTVPHAQTVPPSPIVVAQPQAPRSGSADYQRDFALGAKVYFDHVNLAGGIRGRRIVHRLVDTADAPARRLLAERPDVLFGIVGDATIDAVARDPAVRAGRLPLFATIGYAPAAGDGAIALRPSLDDEIVAMLAQLQQFGIASFALLHGNDLPGATIAQIEQRATGLGIGIAVRQVLLNRSANQPEAIQAVFARRPQAVLAIADTLGVANFFREYRKRDPGAFLATSSQADIRTLTEVMGSQAARGLIVSQVVPSPNAPSEIAREHRRLMARYADEPASPATLEGFIAARVLVTALNGASEITPTALRRALSASGKLRLGGFALDFERPSRPSDFVELSVVTRDGKLLR
ncbi:MAG: ABC transporter substrate-binding protein [Azonexaceae bacterium]|nr:ABC transporter substrate-binding protein [Azonexaceae bacterium]